MVSFNNPVIQYLVIPSGATSGARIVLDGVNGFILVYDAFDSLVASVAGKPGSDNFGNFIYPGVTSYDSTTQLIAVDLGAGQVIFQPLGNPSQTPASIIGTNMLGFDSVAPLMQLVSPNSNAAFRDTIFELWGASKDGTALERARLYAQTGDIDFQVTGIIRYGIEVWNQPGLNVNWANVGAPFGNFAYRRNALGAVEFTGMLQWNGAATPAPDPVFTLPAGYRPNRIVHLGILSSPAAGTNPTTETVEITTAGVVQITNYGVGPNTPLSFEGLGFYLTAP